MTGQRRGRVGGKEHVDGRGLGDGATVSRGPSVGSRRSDLVRVLDALARLPQEGAVAAHESAHSHDLVHVERDDEREAAGGERGKRVVVQRALLVRGERAGAHLRQSAREEVDDKDFEVWVHQRFRQRNARRPSARSRGRRLVVVVVRIRELPL